MSTCFDELFLQAFFQFGKNNRKNINTSDTHLDDGGDDETKVLSKP